jgi:hypothetical protein
MQEWRSKTYCRLASTKNLKMSANVNSGSKLNKVLRQLPINYQSALMGTMVNKIYATCGKIILKTYSIVSKTNRIRSVLLQHWIPLLLILSEIVNAITRQKAGKCPESDFLYVKHFKFSDSILHGLLMVLFNCMFVHFFVPDDFTKVTIITLLKSKIGNLADKK